MRPKTLSFPRLKPHNIRNKIEEELRAGLPVTTVKSQQNTNWSTTTALNWNWKESSRPLRSVSNVSCQILIQRRSLEASISGFIQLSNSRILSPVIHMNTIKALTPQHSSS
ncbi:hypothetical protein WN943_008000 [Citrus x changshan-huyou]